MPGYSDIPSLFPLNGEQTRIQRLRLQRRRGWQLAAALAGIILLSSLLGWRLAGNSSAPPTAPAEPSTPLADPVLATPTPPAPVLITEPLTDPASPAHTLTNLTFTCSSDHLLASATVTNSSGKPLGWAGLRLTTGATTLLLTVPPLAPDQSLPLFFAPTSCSDAGFPSLSPPSLALLFCNPP